MITISLEDVILIHDSVIEPEELQGLATDKSLESCLMRVENRLQYGMINDVFELAALYAVAIATGHCFNDSNKRTAVTVMDTCLVLNGIELNYQTTELGDKIIAAAEGKLSEVELAKWLLTLHLKM